MDKKLSRAELRRIRNDLLSGKTIENTAQMGERGALVRRMADEIVSELVRLERLIILADRTLRVSQPPIEGKLGVRWWLQSGKSEVRMPELVTYHKNKAGQTSGRRVRRLHRDRIARTGTAALCADDTFTLAQAAGMMRKEYEWLKQTLDNVLRLAPSVSKRRDRISNIEAAVVEAHTHVVDTLIAAGYEVDKETRELAEKYLE